MVKRNAERPFQLGRYFLSRRSNSPMWCRTWFDAATRQTRRVSLGTTDFERAKRELAAWVLVNDEPRQRPAEQVTVAEVFARYYERHGKHTVGAGVQRRNLYVVGELLAEVTVGELSLDRQEKLIRDLRAAGYADGTIKRMLGAAKAALRWAYERGEIDRVPPIVRVPDSPARERILSILELAALWDAAEADHVRMFILLLLGTAARPAAVLELTRFQCDTTRGLIDLNPPGRQQTKKRRPVVPMCPTLRAWIIAAPAGPLVQYRGRPVHKISAAFRNVRERAGLGPDVVPYSLRHTIATEMRARGVPELELAGMLGHAMPQFRSTGRYAKYDPSYLSKAAEAIEAVLGFVDKGGPEFD